MKLLVGLALLLTLTQAHAATITEDFTSRARHGGGTAIWNHSLGVVHPTMSVRDYTGGGPFDPRDVDPGDGSDGAFVPSRYAEFSQGGDLSGNIIRLNKSELKVTEFLLEEGWILEPVNNDHLIIRSLGSVTIRGEIWCHGRDGGDAVGGQGGAGGEPRCGGARGGNGGDTGANGEDGDDISAPDVTGGLGGANNGGGAGGGGGGGGAWNDASLSADGAGHSGFPGDPGDGGASFNDPSFATIAGGAGGGGGGAGSTGAGGGGGAGGGVVIIHSVGDFNLGSPTNPNIGFIFANGGNGGSGSGNGGLGGRGGGGSVQVFSGATIRLYSNSGVGASQAVSGHLPTVGASGGIGRNWFTSIAYDFTLLGFPDPTENVPVIPGDNVFYNTAAEDVISTPIDLGNSRVEILGISTTPESGDFTLEFAGSSDNFVTDDTGWTSNLADIAGKRYVRFKVTITTNATNPTLLDAVTIQYLPGLVSDFEFESAGCGRVDGNPPHSIILLLIPLLTLLIARRRLARR